MCFFSSLIKPMITQFNNDSNNADCDNRAASIKVLYKIQPDNESTLRDSFKYQCVVLGRSYTPSLHVRITVQVTYGCLLNYREFPVTHLFSIFVYN